MEDALEEKDQSLRPESCVPEACSPRATLQGTGDPREFVSWSDLEMGPSLGVRAQIMASLLEPSPRFQQ